MNFLKNLFGSHDKSTSDDLDGLPKKGERGALNQSQEKCVRQARWVYQDMKGDLLHNKSADLLRTPELFWHLVFAHFKEITEVHAGYSLDLPLPRIIERINEVKKVVLFPKLAEIIRCTDVELKGRLVAEYVYILMAAVFDPTGSTIRYDILCHVLDVKADTNLKAERGHNRGEYLEPLGFTPHQWNEGAEVHTTWYWSTKKVESNI